MEIVFEDDKLEGLCTQQKKAHRLLGTKSAKKLRTRLADMMAAEKVSELIAGNPHPLKGDRQGQFSLSLADGNRICFIPYHDPTPRYPDGGINWSEISSVQIVFIGDYHD